VLDREGIPAQILALEPDRANLVARLKATETKRPLLLMGHTDVVSSNPPEVDVSAVRRDARRRLHLWPRLAR